MTLHEIAALCIARMASCVTPLNDVVAHGLPLDPEKLVWRQICCVDEREHIENAIVGIANDVGRESIDFFYRLPTISPSLGILWDIAEGHNIVVRVMKTSYPSAMLTLDYMFQRQ